MIHFNPGRALELLRQGSNNPNAQFRDGQEEAIAHLVTNTQRLLVVQKTGWGKKFCLFYCNTIIKRIRCWHYATYFAIIGVNA
ncbi:hypothetical protein [Moraxella bovis]|uniref:Uncharacterized protein n=1 Tax=Moraxella bovis TaxID=476 RepID=A0AAQ2Q249_MORBO|nr:hypothetical protein [Moraxella bovis]UYZ76229.1 hypothetical protein LP093_02595 [Moraxella bovis]UYZ77819.1 hypothetical protein LP115_11210 [Moraxella bovis]UYZ86305.1 hypothetical protein LP094_11260 [Moraxella bovis]UYZ88986.1 hypothetical protein LP114_11210 [Moraxella bovis]UYZ91738.1 hypothetical protein LP103_11320 [Moraxella bovis]